MTVEALTEEVPQQRRWPENRIGRMAREDRFLAVRAYLRWHVIVRTTSRRVSDAEVYPGYVEAVAWGLDGSQDVLVLTLSGPKGAGMPQVSISLPQILSITPKLETDE